MFIKDITHKNVKIINIIFQNFFDNRFFFNI